MNSVQLFTKTNILCGAAVIGGGALWAAHRVPKIAVALVILGILGKVLSSFYFWMKGDVKLDNAINGSTSGSGGAAASSSQKSAAGAMHQPQSTSSIPTDDKSERIGVNEAPGTASPTLFQDFAHVVTFVLSAECPHKPTSSAPLCIYINKPDERTDKMMDAIRVEIGPHSQSYYNMVVGNTGGTGDGRYTMSAYVQPYLINTATNQFTNVPRDSTQGIRIGGMSFSETIREIVFFEFERQLKIHYPRE